MPRLCHHETPERRRQEASRWRSLAALARLELERVAEHLDTMPAASPRRAYWTERAATWRALAHERDRNAEREENRAAATAAALDRGEVTR